MSARILCGDVRAVLPTLPAASVQCCVTSPPYWGLRDYGIPPSVWGGDPACGHDWSKATHYAGGGQPGEKVRWQHVGEGPPGHPKVTTAFCSTCGAWRGCLGLEPTYGLYVDHMVEVFAEVRRVLRPDGTLWLNLGDCYATGAGAVGDCPGGGEQGARWKLLGPARKQVPDGKNPDAGVPTYQPNRMPQPGLKPKDLCGIPWRVAFALQDFGWWLRSDVIWSKPNPMPESVTDRPTKAHEYLFLLTKSERYFYDADAILEPLADASAARYGYAFGGAKADALLEANKDGIGRRTTPIGFRDPTEGRNRRTVWTIATQPFPGAHFAVMPEALVEPCILAGSREGDTVLDPFAGSGTVGVVALRKGRGFIGCELNPTYAAMARDRIRDDAPLLNSADVA